VYAGFLEYADHHIGRVIDALADLGVLEDTLVYYIIGDNGASAEGTLQGCFNAAGIVNGPGLETIEYLRERIDQLGGPEAYNHYAVGWAHAMCTPYQWTKQVGSHRRAAQPVHPRHRRRPDRARGCRTARTNDCAWRHPGTHPGHQHGLQLRRRQRGRAACDPVLRDVLQPRHLPPRAGRR
jgi:Sulfatase